MIICSACMQSPFNRAKKTQSDVSGNRGAVALQAVVTLQTQYRMCSNIMAIANALTYGGRLRCGNALVEHGMLSLTSNAHASAPAWLQQACSHAQYGNAAWARAVPVVEVEDTDAALRM